jgi:alpha-glucosidase
MACGPLLRNGQSADIWTFDAYKYKPGDNNLYEAHPWVLAVRPDGSAFGVLADTTFRCQVDLDKGIRFTAKDNFPVIVIDRLSPQDVLRALADLTGHMPLPPRWALGYHQARFSYYPAERVLELASAFRDKQIPCDALWMDIDYMDGYRIFSFDRLKFPDPRGLNARLLEKGFHNVWMIDPAVKKEDRAGVTAVFDSGNERDVWVRRANDSPYEGIVWPGWALFPDFTDPRVRTWWGAQFKDFLAQGVTGVWNDMNEPAVFTPKMNPADRTKTMPEDNKHRGDPALLDALGRPQGLDGSRGTHARYHNVYGMMMARATREGVLAAVPERRPFVLARASYLGGQRYAATWTGDNSPTWPHLKLSIPMVLNLGLSGQPFVGPDLGGYCRLGSVKDRDSVTRAEGGRLMARWMGFGALFPFARGHSENYSIPKEPWAFSESVTQTCRLALQRRYRLLPYLYTTFREASGDGLPVVRPLFFADPKDPALRTADGGFLLGGDLLVWAQVDPEQSRPAILPQGGTWVRFGFPALRGLAYADSGASDTTDPDLPDLYLRGGAIVPTGPVVNYTDEKPLDPLTLLVCLDADGKASGKLYEDAGDGYGYEAGDYLLCTYQAVLDKGVVTVSVRHAEGNRPRPARKVVVRVLPDGKFITDNKERVGEGTDGEKVRVPLP